ncbi:hypothetical protein GCM10027345_37220 [Hymenobacter daeguensis]
MRNVVRFNWHFYAIALGAALALGAVSVVLPAYRTAALLGLGLGLLPVFVSLAVTAYVYDFSTLYGLKWLPGPTSAHPGILTINAGFDEISAVLQHRYAPGQLLPVDFYNPVRHTEASIQRARRAYPPYPGTLPVDTARPLPLADAAFDLTFAFLAAHEIRNAAERAAFFRELRRVTRPGGTIIVTEHLRDTANFMAYNIGFLHFHARRAWLETFQAAGLQVAQEIRITPFVTTFLLRPHGSAA